VFIKLFTTCNISQYISDEVGKGSIELALIKPYSFFLYHLFRHLSSLLFELISKGTVLFIVCFSVFSEYITFSNEWSNMFYFVFCLFVAVTLSFFLDYIIGLISFWIIQTWQMKFLITDFGNILSGYFVPLWFFPKVIYNISEYLPFKYMYFMPINVILGTIPQSEFLRYAIIQIAWLLLLGLIIMYLWKNCRTKVLIQGG